MDGEMPVAVAVESDELIEFDACARVQIPDWPRQKKKKNRKNEQTKHQLPPR